MQEGAKAQEARPSAHDGGGNSPGEQGMKRKLHGALGEGLQEDSIACDGSRQSAEPSMRARPSGQCGAAGHARPKTIAATAMAFVLLAAFSAAAVPAVRHIAGEGKLNG